MARIASTALVVALLAATAAAFALTEGLKLERSPIFGTAVAKVFSPVCRCKTRTASIAFRLRKADTVEVSIVDRRGTVVDTVVAGERLGPGRVELAWDGLRGDGTPYPEGRYRPRVHLRDAHRTIVLPNPIALDTTPPRVLTADLAPEVISPDGDSRGDVARVTYRLSEPARAVLYVRGTKRVEQRFARERDSLAWYGIVKGKPVHRGLYSLTLAARDPAGNLGEAVPVGRLTVRYVALGRTRIAVRAGTRLAVRVSADAATIRWRLGGRAGTARPGTLVLRAPEQPGSYTLFVSAAGRAAKAAVIVRERP